MIEVQIYKKKTNIVSSVCSYLITINKKISRKFKYYC